MKLVIIGLMSLIILSGCVDQKAVDCLTPFAKAYCHSSNLTFESASSGDIATIPRFWCDSERMGTRMIYYFTKEELTRCNQSG